MLSERCTRRNGWAAAKSLKCQFVCTVPSLMEIYELSTIISFRTEWNLLCYFPRQLQTERFISKTAILFFVLRKLGATNITVSAWFSRPLASFSKQTSIFRNWRRSTHPPIRYIIILHHEALNFNFFSLFLFYLSPREIFQRDVKNCKVFGNFFFLPSPPEKKCLL